MAKILADILKNKDLSEFGEKKVTEFSAPKRNPIFILIDNSASMSMIADKLSKTVHRVINTLYMDKQVKNTVNLYIDIQ